MISDNPVCLAPVCVFVYKRPAETRQLIQALQANYLSSETDVIIYSDAPKKSADTGAVDAVRDFITTVNGFKSVRIILRESNLGLAQSIITGVSEVLRDYGKVIVLEDDLVTARNFLDFMNAALDFYETRASVFAISGYSYPMKSMRGNSFDMAFGHRSYSWGWATWHDRWNLVDWDIADYNKFIRNRDDCSRFNKGGGSDLSNMLARQMAGKIDSWMIRWVYAQFKYGLLDVFPSASKVLNIGFNGTATHTRCSDRRYRTILDTGTKRVFQFNPVPAVNYDVQKELEWLHSYRRRAFYKMLDLLTLKRH